MDPKWSTVWIPTYKKAFNVYMDKKVVFDKLHPGTIYSAVGHRFNVNESPMNITWGGFKQKYM